jgi:raffinose/stachyose/melibiose transport system permease protein
VAKGALVRLQISYMTDPKVMREAISTYGRAPVALRLRTRNLQPYIWVAPALLVFGVFTLLPLAVGLWLSLTGWNGTAAPVFNGIDNYTQALHDGGYWLAIVHNIIYAVGTVAGKILLGLGLALVMNQTLPGRAIFRTALFMPVMLSFVAIGLLWSWIYNYDFGLLNGILEALHLVWLKQDWLGSPSLALYALIVVDIWKWFGLHMVLFLAGLQNIPSQLYEAARIDGATSWQSFRWITLPLLLPITAFNFVLAASGAFNVFDLVYVMTQGGPVEATNVAMNDIYREAFQFYHFGYSAALSVVQLGLVIIVSLAILFVTGRQGKVIGEELA